VITEEANLPAACMKLIDLANANGGPDNITVVAARFEGDGLAPPSARDPIGHAVYPFGGDVTPQMPIGRFTTNATPTTPTDGTGPASAPVSGFAPRAGATTVRKGTPVLLLLGLVAVIVLAALAAYRMIVSE
jgi:protein phosphatase